MLLLLLALGCDTTAPHDTAVPVDTSAPADSAAVDTYAPLDTYGSSMEEPCPDGTLLDLAGSDAAGAQGG